SRRLSVWLVAQHRLSTTEEVRAMALRNGSRLGVSMHDVFPHGCHLVPGSITETIDYDEATGRRSPAVDKHTGKPVFQCRVSDMDPRSEEHTSELQSLAYLVCRLLLEK